MPTATAVLQQGIRKAGFGYYVPAVYITALDATTFTAPFFFANNSYGNNNFLGWGVYRPSAGTANNVDQFRQITSLAPATGVATVGPISWTDTTKGTEDIFLLRPGITPLHVIDALQLSLNKLYFPNSEPLGIKPVGAVATMDSGFQSSATSSYTASGATFAKFSTASSENVFRGERSGSLTNAGYIYQQFAVAPNEQVYIYALSRLSSGTSASLVVRDATNSAAIGTTVTHSHRKWMWMRRVESQTSTGELMDVRLTNDGASDVSYWNAFTLMPAGTKRIILDTKWDRGEFTQPALYYLEFGASAGSNIYDAFSTTPREVPRHLYSWDPERPSPNPTAIQFHDGIETYLQHPLYIQGRRAYGDITTVTVSTLDTAESKVDIDLWDAAFRCELFSMGDVYDRLANADELLSRAVFDFQAVAPQFPIEGPSKKERSRARTYLSN